MFRSARYFNIYLGVGILVVVMSSCVSKYHFVQSDIVPAAEGKLKIKQIGKKKYSIEADILYLVALGSLATPGKYYIVWIEKEDDSTKTLGQLKIVSSLFSTAVKGSINSVSHSNRHDFSSPLETSLPFLI